MALLGKGNARYRKGMAVPVEEDMEPTAAEIKEMVMKVSDRPWLLRDLPFQNEEICMAAVKKGSWTLCFAKVQTPEMCRMAIMDDPDALRDVREQTRELCLLAVQLDGCALAHVREQTPEICLAAIEQDPMALIGVREQTPEICIAALEKDEDVAEYVEIPLPGTIYTPEKLKAICDRKDERRRKPLCPSRDRRSDPYANRRPRNFQVMSQNSPQMSM